MREILEAVAGERENLIYLAQNIAPRSQADESALASVHRVLELADRANATLATLSAAGVNVEGAAGNVESIALASVLNVEEHPGFKAAVKRFIIEQLTEENCDRVISEVIKRLPRGVRYIAGAGLDAATPGALIGAIEVVF